MNGSEGEGITHTMSALEHSPEYVAERAHLSSFINRFFSLSSSLALTVQERCRTSHKFSQVSDERHDETNVQLDLLSMSSIN